MERFDIEQPAICERPIFSASSSGPALAARERALTRTRKTIGASEGAVAQGQLISLRKYSAAICLVEALAIVLLVYLLLRLPAPSARDEFHCQGRVSNASAPYCTYSDERGSTLPLLLGLAAQCSQRKHDLAFSVQCEGRAGVRECAPVESAPRGRADGGRPPVVVASSSAGAGAGDELVAEIIETSRAGARLERRVEPLKRVQRNICSEPLGLRCELPNTRARTLAELHVARKGQAIIGWGGALTDSAINNVLALSTNATLNLLADYFGPDGLRFNMVRITIGGSDFSSRFYTNDDLDEPAAGGAPAGASSGGPPAGPVDWSLSKFKLAQEDVLYKIPVLRFIKEEFFGSGAGSGDGDGVGAGNARANELKVFASMWSPPVWMKDNRHFNRGHLRGTISNATAPEPAPGSKLRDDPEAAYAALAKLKIEFLDAYRAAGVRLWGLTVMNEPVFAVQPFLNFNTMIFPRADYANYVSKYLGPRLRAHPELASTRLMVHDDNRRYLAKFTKPLLEDARVRPYVDGVSVHGYVDEDYWRMTEIYEEFGERNPADATDSAAEQGPLARGDFFVLPTELCSGHLPFMEEALAGNWHRGMHYALDIIRSLQARAAGWVDWNMALDTRGGPGWLGGRLDAPVLVDRARDLYHRSPMFYVLGQFSRYVPAGSRRLVLVLSNAHYDAHLEAVAFETPERKLVLVVVNNNPYPVELHWRFALNLKRPLKWLPDERPDQQYLTTSPADSVQTIVLPPLL